MYRIECSTFYPANDSVIKRTYVVCGDDSADAAKTAIERFIQSIDTTATMMNDPVRGSNDEHGNAMYCAAITTSNRLIWAFDRTMQYNTSHLHHNELHTIDTSSHRSSYQSLHQASSSL